MITVRTTPGQDSRSSTCASSRRGSRSRRGAGTTICKDALIDALGEARGNELFRRFGGALPAGYREDFTARAAVPDIEMMARLVRRASRSA